MQFYLKSLCASSFPRIFRVPQREKPLFFWWVSLCDFFTARVGGSGVCNSQFINTTVLEFFGLSKAKVDSVSARFETHVFRKIAFQH